MLQYLIIIPALLAINIWQNIGYYWAFYPALGWGLGVLLHALVVFERFSPFGADWEKQQVENAWGARFDIHAGQLMGRFSRHRQKGLRHASHHHAVSLCGRMPDCGWVYLAALTLFGEFDLACVVGVALIQSITQNYQTSSFKRCFGILANALSRLTKVAFNATAWAAIIMSKLLRLMSCASKLQHSSP